MFLLVKSFVEHGLEGSTRDPKMIKIMKVISKSYLDSVSRVLICIIEFLF